MEGVLEGADSGAVAGAAVQQRRHSARDRRRAAAQGPGRAPAPEQAERDRHSEILLFCRHMYTLLKSGVPIMGALKGLQETADKPAFEDHPDLRESLDSGRELSAALARHPSASIPFYVSMVRVGE